MKKYGLNSAEYIKCLFIDFLLSKGENLIIGNEFMYGIKRKVVDLVVLKNDNIIAVEIKSNSDNLKRLEEQILEYKKIFDYVLIVATEKHINKICEVTSSSIGVYVIKNNLVINKIRSPHIQRNKDKTEMLFSINAKYLCKLNHYNLRNYNADEVRNMYKKRRISNIQEILRKYIIKKYKERYCLFINERGVQTHIEDLCILSSSFQIE